MADSSDVSITAVDTNVGLSTSAEASAAFITATTVEGSSGAALMGGLSSSTTKVDSVEFGTSSGVGATFSLQAFQQNDVPYRPM